MVDLEVSEDEEDNMREISNYSSDALMDLILKQNKINGLQSQKQIY